MLRKAFKDSAAYAGVVSWIGAMVILAYALNDWEFDWIAAASAGVVLFGLPASVLFDVCVAALRRAVLSRKEAPDAGN